MFQTLLPSDTTPLVTTRVVAIVHASVFDAVNGIERRYTPIHVTQKGPHGVPGEPRPSRRRTMFTPLLGMSEGVMSFLELEPENEEYKPS